MLAVGCMLVASGTTAWATHHYTTRAGRCTTAATMVESWYDGGVRIGGAGEPEEPAHIHDEI